METYKGFNYKVMRSSFGTINAVIVFIGNTSESFTTIKEAKRYITLYTA